MDNSVALTESEKNWGLFCHLSSFSSFFIPFGGIIGPLICWSAKRNESAWVDYQGKESLNFQLSILIYSLLCIPLIFIVVGVLLLGVIFLLEFILVIIATVKTAQGERFKYPITIPFIQ
jgi:uncharacterized protein